MVTRDGIVKVLDFGLAKLRRPAALTATDTLSPTRERSRPAPGVVSARSSTCRPSRRAARPWTCARDIFSFGWCSTRCSPAEAFQGQLLDLDSHRRAARRAAPLAQYFPGLPSELGRIVGKALRKDREERYQLSKELLVDLKSLKQELEFEAKSGRPSLLNLSRARRAAGPASRGGATGPRRARAAGQTSELLPSTISELLISEVRQHRKGVALTAALAALALAAAAFGLYQLIESARRPDTFQTMRLARLTRAGDVVEKMVAISPAGRHVAYVTQDEGRQSALGQAGRHLGQRAGRSAGPQRIPRADVLARRRLHLLRRP